LESLPAGLTWFLLAHSQYLSFELYDRFHSIIPHCLSAKAFLSATMAGLNDDIVSPFGPLQNELARMRGANLTAAIQDVDQIIEHLVAAREQIAAGTNFLLRVPIP
jgi:hypothetical protein